MSYSDTCLCGSSEISVHKYFLNYRRHIILVEHIIVMYSIRRKLEMGIELN